MFLTQRQKQILQILGVGDVFVQRIQHLFIDEIQAPVPVTADDHIRTVYTGGQHQIDFLTGIFLCGNFPDQVITGLLLNVIQYAVVVFILACGKFFHVVGAKDPDNGFLSRIAGITPRQSMYPSPAP